MKRYLKKILRELAIFTSLTFLSYVFYALIPYFTKLLFEGFYVEAFIGYIVCLGMFILLSYFANISQVKYQLKFDRYLKEDYFIQVANLNYEEFSKKKVGEYISFQANDITSIGSDYLAPLMNIITQSLRVATNLVVITITLDFRVSIILIGASFLGVILPKRLGGETAKRRNNYLNCQKEYYSKIEEVFNGFKIIDFRTRNQVINSHSNYLGKVIDERYKYGKANSLMWSLNGLGSESINFISFVYLGYLSIRGNMSPAFAIATFQYAQSLMEPVHEILFNLSMINSSKAFVNSYLQFIDFRSRETKKVKPDVFDRISIRNLNKSYERFSLREINFDLEKDKKYALIGANGSGKSTLFNILASYIQDYSGHIQIDGKDIRDIEPSYLIGIMNQDEFIFTDDLNNNSTIFNSYKNVGDNTFKDEVENIKQNNNCRTLSGGEKKIVGLTRLINKETKVILLDEPFSSVNENKKEVLLDKLLSLNKTIVMITHDIDESLSKFDMVLMMKEGQLIYRLPYEILKDKKEFEEFKKTISAS